VIVTKTNKHGLKVDVIMSKMDGRKVTDVFVDYGELLWECDIRERDGSALLTINVSEFRGDIEVAYIDVDGEETIETINNWNVYFNEWSNPVGVIIESAEGHDIFDLMPEHVVIVVDTETVEVKFSFFQ